MNLDAYQAVRGFMAPGDVIAFSGRGFASWAIRLFTRSSVSHVGVVYDARDENGERVVMIIESTTLNGRKGVQKNRLSARLRDYEGGAACWLPLMPLEREILERNIVTFYAFIEAQMGDGYDKGSVFRQIPIIGPLFWRDDPREECCSELGAQIFQATNLIHGVDTYRTSPQEICEMGLYEKCVPILGAMTIRRFNTR
jgi:hypothetical protein